MVGERPRTGENRNIVLGDGRPLFPHAEFEIFEKFHHVNGAKVSGLIL